MWRCSCGSCLPRIGFVFLVSVVVLVVSATTFAAGEPAIHPYPVVPLIDVAFETGRQVIVDREPGQYLGHPTTLLLEDGKTILCVYPKGHGKGAIQYKRSSDGGLTWSDRLPTPASWETSLETPTLHRTIDKEGKKRIVLFSGMYPIRRALSEDDGVTWTELEPIGDFGGIVAMGSVERLANGNYMAFFHDDGRFLKKGGVEKPPVFRVYQTTSGDGGVTWAAPIQIAHLPDAHLCEPGTIRSPDGSTIAVLLRENSRKHNSYVITSKDEGATWSEPREVAGDLTGDRHVCKYAEDGRLVVTFRDTARQTATPGDWIVWVGRFDDLLTAGHGEYRVRLMDNTSPWDSTYAGLERLPNGGFVTTTYGHWTKGEPPYIVSVRFRLDEFDARFPKMISTVGR